MTWSNVAVELIILCAGVGIFQETFTNTHSRNFSHKICFLSALVLNLCILLVQTKLRPNQNILLNTSPCLPQMCPTSHFRYLRCSTAFDLVSIVFTLNVSKPSKYTFPNHQTHWFQSQQLCEFFTFLSFST